ncbi:MAG: TolC family protein [Bacteroidota bacterium]
MLRQILTTFLSLVLGSGFLFAQVSDSDIWSLRRCLEYAKESNIQLKQAELNVESGEISLAQSKAQRLPNMNFGGNYGLRFGLFEDPLTNTLSNTNVRNLDIGLSSRVDLYRAGAISNGIKQSQIDLEANQADLTQQEYDLALDITLAYLTILQRSDLLESSLLQISSTREQRDRTEKLVDAGSLARADLLQLESQIATEEVNVVNATNNLELGYLALQQLLNLDPDGRFSIEKLDLPDPEGDFLDAVTEEVYEFAEANQPFIRSAELNVESAKLGIKIAESDRIPSLSLSGNYGTGYSSRAEDITGEGVGGQFSVNRSGSVTLGLSVPIYNRRNVQSNVERAVITYKNAQFTSELRKQNLRQTIEQAYVDLKNAYSTYNSTVKQVDALDLAFTNTEKQFNLGVVNSVDYLLAKNNLNRARFDLVRAKYTYIFRQKVLDFYQGKPIGF